MANVFFLNKNQQVVANYDTSELLSCVQTEEITTNASELLNDTLSLSMFYNELIKDIRYIVLKDKKTKMYQVLKTSDEDNIIYFECVNFAVTELENFIVKDVRPKDKDIKQVLQQLLDDSGCTWLIGDCSLSLNVTSSFYYVSIKEALKSLQEKGCEFTFDIEITGNKITKKFINCYSKIGVNNHRRFEYGEDVLKIVHEQDRTNIVTAIIGRGRGEEVGDGYGRRIEFSNIEWKKSDGKPLDKPKGQNYLEYPEMTQEYGIPDNGRMLPRKQVVVFDDIEEPNELLQKTYETLLYYCRPLVQFSTEILGSDAIGNVVSIHRGDRNYHYETRVFKVVTDFINGKVESSLGDNLTSTSNAARQISKVQSDLTTLDDKKMTFYQSTEIGKYQDDIMRGAGKNGGSVYWVNGVEAGVSNSREVYEEVFMDGPTIAESQHFLVQNNSGISFKHCQKGEWKTIQDVHNGASNTAWTLDGTFVADFIKAGILSGILVMGNLIKTIGGGGAYQAVMHEGQVMIEEYTETTNVDYSKPNWQEEVRGKRVGGLVGTYSNGKANGSAIVNHPGYIFSINQASESGNSSPIFQVPKESTFSDRLYNLNGKGTFKGEVEFNESITANKPSTFKEKVEFEDQIEVNRSATFKNSAFFEKITTFSENAVVLGRLDVGELYVNGTKIDTNGGSGGGSSPAPSEDGATYEPKNIASNIANNTNIKNWLEKYTKQYGIEEYIGLAYALIMVENADTDGTDDIMQSSESAGYPGPGYLTGEASVKQGCKHLSNVLKSSFAKNVDVWGAMQSYNFGSAYVDWLASRGGKNTTDLAEEYSRDVVAPSLGNTTGATYSYVNAVSQADGRTYLYSNGGNFHYAAMIRQYVTVTEGTTDNWAIPIAKPLTVTSEFGWRTSPITGAQELHNGIDLVNGNGTTPIYAAGAGEVVVSMFEQSYGNYIIIKHANGIYTGYAHQSKRLVSAGDTVKRGQQIGNMGSTGDSTGAHLHFQFFRNGPWPNDWPNDFINPRDMMQF